QPTVSNLNYVGRQVVPNAFTVGLGPTGAFDVFTYSRVHFIVDITGYYARPSPGGLYYHPLPAPVRLLDTRAGQPGPAGCDRPNTPIPGTGYRVELGATLQQCTDIPVGPGGAQALVGNATVVNSGSSAGFASLQPG